MAYIELHQSNFFHNLDQIRQKVRVKEKIAIVLKDNAYGHGLLEIAGMSKEYGIKHAVVRTLSEAQVIENLFDTILVLADEPKGKVPENVHITINDLAIIPTLLPNTKVELKIDSGMHRNGITHETLETAITQISKANLNLVGVFTHHRSADTLSSEFFWQKKNFERTKKTLSILCAKNTIPMPRFHSLNSAGAFREESFNEDIVRVGIAAYGLLEMQSPLFQPDLRPVLSLWAQKIHEFETSPQIRMGYNGRGIALKKQMLATYDIGYGDGLLRLNDAQEYVTDQGIALLGRVSMDNITLASTEKNLRVFANANAYAKAADTISYEVTTRLHPQIKRTIIK